MERKLKKQKYNRTAHGDMLVGWLSAWDHDDLNDGAWQAVLESGGEAFSEHCRIAISGFDAFMEYVMLNDQGEQQ